MKKEFLAYVVILLAACASVVAQEPWKPYGPPCVEREDVFSFTQKPSVKLVGKDKYEIAFAVKGNCDVTVGIVDKDGKVVRHLASGVLGANAPSPFRKDSLSQSIYWNGKDDLDRYVKEPGELKVRVMLGLKPVFHKRLGGTSGHNIPGVVRRKHRGPKKVRGIVIGPDGGYVLSFPGLFGHLTVRKFDHDGNYLQSLSPPPRKLPESKLAGMGCVEYEPGKRAVHAPIAGRTVSGDGAYLPGINSKVESIQPGLAGNRLVYTTQGTFRTIKSQLYYIRTDGSTDVPGMSGLELVKGSHHENPRMATSPDGSKVYVSAVYATKGCSELPCTSIFAHTLEAGAKAEPFVGRHGTPGTDNEHLSDARGIDTDAEGRVYVADHKNNRIQVFSPEGKYLKTIKIDRPNLVCVHKKTGAIYVQHTARVRGKSITRITKLTSLADPKKELHQDGLGGMMALDSWSAKPRFWFGGHSVTIWEERGRGFEKIRHFLDDARKEAGDNWFGYFNGAGSLWSSRAACDPVAEKVYFGFTGLSHVFDLGTGAYEGILRLPGKIDDMIFDKRGYLHEHFNPRFFTPGVGRFDTAKKQGTTTYEGQKAFQYPECPYDYGIEKGKFTGLLPVKDQLGAKGFQDGVGVNMRGDIAVQSYIYYVPKMDEIANKYMMPGNEEMVGMYGYRETFVAHENWVRRLQELIKKGVNVYFIGRRPGIPLVGATIWIHDFSGELRRTLPVVVGNLVNGVQLDEDGFIYFATNRTRNVGEHRFLGGKQGRLGMPMGKKPGNPFTGVYVKTDPEKFTVLQERAAVPLDEPLKRSLDMHGSDGWSWVEGAEWIYAGASPMVWQQPCSCPQLRAHMDWYKRSYVPEAYRHSFAILDTNGNLVLHVGRYANFDSAPGGRNGCKPGDTDIGITCARFISGTDNYLAFEDWGERLVVLKLDYHAEETVPIGIP
jgi:DNA-binding beta-propeller fold protein YncE